MWMPSSDTYTTSSPESGPLQRWLHMDGTLLVVLALLGGFGMVVLYSAFEGHIEDVERQAVRLAIAFAVLVVAAQVPPAMVRRWSLWAYAGGVALLIAVLLVGDAAGGARRWIDLGFVQFQPSEIMKLAVPMAISAFLANNGLPPSWARLLAALALIAVPAVLIAVQPDLGTAVLVTSSGCFVLFLSGLSWRLIFGFAGLAAAAAPLLWFFGMHDYQRQRILTFLNPERDPLGAGYHIIQSKIAIGSGGLYGKGWLNGTQSHLQFLPERHTDFVFAVLAEEFGLIGVCMLLTAYLVVVARGLWIAANAPETYGRLLAGALSLTFFVYVFINIGMVSGLLPVVGVPLPLISYGGTSMVTIMAAFGMLMSIHTHRRLWA